MVTPTTYAQALAFVLRDCTLQSSALACRLASILHALYVTAVVLAAILVLCITVAVQIYRRRKVDRSTVL